MRRRELIAWFGCAAAMASPHRAMAQTRARRIGWLSGLGADDPQIVANRAALVRGLKELGWNEGQNYTVEFRAALGNVQLYHDLADELVRSGPDIALCSGDSAFQALLEDTHSIPVVFVQVYDPVTLGYVAGLPHPGANVTGFTQFPTSIGTKWLQLLEDIAPEIKHVGVFSFDYSAGLGTLNSMLPSMRQAAASRAIGFTLISVTKAADVNEAIVGFAKGPNGGLIFPPDVKSIINREMIVAAVNRNALPAIYPYRIFAESGGLISYASDPPDNFYRAATYIDRILRGANPGELPVQEPIKYELVINMRTAKALGRTIPPMLLATADDVIE
jgi:putative ABC transport system substrate-binding protein